MYLRYSKLLIKYLYLIYIGLLVKNVVYEDILVRVIIVLKCQVTEKKKVIWLSSKLFKKQLNSPFKLIAEYSRNFLYNNKV